MSDSEYSKARQDPKIFKVATRLSIKDFDALLPIFKLVWLDFIENKPNKNLPAGEDKLPTVADKLFFILYYQKTRVLSKGSETLFDSLSVSVTKNWIHLLEPLLNLAKTQQNDAKLLLEEAQLKQNEANLILKKAQLKQNEIHVADANESLPQDIEDDSSDSNWLRNIIILIILAIGLYFFF